MKSARGFIPHRTGAGFTLIEILVVVAIIGVLSTIGMVAFGNVQGKARDTKRKGDIDAIAKAYETAYKPFLYQYRVLTGSDFQSGLPTPPEGGNYYNYLAESGSTYKVCAALEGGTAGCTDNSATCYCKSAALGRPTIAAGNTPTAASTSAPVQAPAPSSTVAPTAAPTAIPTSAPTSAPTAVPTPSPTSAPIFPSSGLVAYWKLDETTGTTIGDSFDSKNGTANSSTNITISDKISGAAARTFDGETQNVNMGNVLSFERTDPFSISVWFKRGRSRGGINERLVTKQTIDSQNRGYGININDNRILFSLTNDYTNGNLLRIRSTIGNFTTTIWHHVVVTYDGSSQSSGINLYIENTLDQNQTTLNNNLSGTIINTISFMIASSPSNTRQFQGTLDEIGIWNRALTASEVSALYNSGAGLTYTP